MNIFNMREILRKKFNFLSVNARPLSLRLMLSVFHPILRRVLEKDQLFALYSSAWSPLQYTFSEYFIEGVFSKAETAQYEAGQSTVFHQPVVRYQLYNSPYLSQWLKLFRYDSEVKKKPIWHGGIFYGDLFSSRSTAEKELQGLIRQLSERISDFSAYLNRPMDDQALTELHGIKERYAQPELLRSLDKKMIDALDRLNFVIHKFDTFVGGLSGSVVAVPFPPSRKSLRYFFYYLFTRKIEPNLLYVDYGTNGMTVIDSFLHSHDELPVPQKQLNSGLYFSFRGSQSFKQLESLDDWYRAKWKRSIFNCRSALGYLPLGEIVGDVPIDVLRERLRGSQSVEVRLIKGSI